MESKDLQRIQEILETLRKNPPAEIAGYKVLKARDYKADTIQDMQTGEVSSTGLPTSNVLYYDLSDDAWLCVRPSGTEPKVKFLLRYQRNPPFLMQMKKLRSYGQRSAGND